MAQITIYINNKIEAKAKKLAKEVNLSTNKYASTILKQKTVNYWGRDIKNLSGSWSDFSTNNTKEFEKIHGIKLENWF